MRTIEQLKIEALDGLMKLDASLAECARPLCFEAPMTVSTAMSAACLLDAVNERHGIGAMASLAIALANTASVAGQWNPPAAPHCPYCATTQGLRIASQDPWGGHVEYICEECFTPQDDGPCFDDLPLPDNRRARHARGRGPAERGGGMSAPVIMGTPEEAKAELIARTEEYRDSIAAFGEPLKPDAAEHEALVQLGKAALRWLWHEENAAFVADYLASKAGV
jgi:hypothetical protein